MKKLFFATAAVLFIGFTAFAAFTQEEAKSIEKCHAQIDQNDQNVCAKKNVMFNKWSEYVAEMKLNTGDVKRAEDTAKAKAAEKRKEKLLESEIIAKPKMYFMIPMADSMPADTTGGC